MGGFGCHADLFGPFGDWLPSFLLRCPAFVCQVPFLVAVVALFVLLPTVILHSGTEVHRSAVLSMGCALSVVIPVVAGSVVIPLAVELLLWLPLVFTS